jgi:hypothetical protein
MTDMIERIGHYEVVGKLGEGGDADRLERSACWMTRGTILARAGREVTEVCPAAPRRRHDDM